MTIALLALLLVAGLGGLALLLRSVFDQRLTGMEDKLDRRLGDLDTRVNGRLEGLDGRLLTSQQSAGQTASNIAEKLGRMEGATAQMLARANDLAKLEQALRPPKSRGGFVAVAYEWRVQTSDSKQHLPGLHLPTIMAP